MHRHPDPCPSEFEYYDGACYKISLNLASFVEAEINCLSSTSGDSGRYRSHLMWTEKQHHYEFVGRKMKERVGESEFWIGLDNRAGRTLWETSLGEQTIATTHPLWEYNLGSRPFGTDKCATIPGPNGG